jgi:hypothetical protein
MLDTKLVLPNVVAMLVVPAILAVILSLLFLFTCMATPNTPLTPRAVVATTGTSKCFPSRYGLVYVSSQSLFNRNSSLSDSHPGQTQEEHGDSNQDEEESSSQRQGHGDTDEEESSV